MKHLIAIMLVFALAGQSLWAATPDQKHQEKIRNKVSQRLDDGRPVSIETYDNRQFAGTISHAGRDNFVLTNAAGQTTLSYSDVKKVKSPSGSHKGVVIAALVGAGCVAGAALGMRATHDH